MRIARLAPTWMLILLGTSFITLPITAEEPPAKPSGPIPTQTSCFNCHSQLDGMALEPTKLASEDIHFQKGLSCHDCHGGDPTTIDDMDASHDPKKGWTAKPDRLHIPEFCAKCHSDATFMKRFDPRARVDQLSEYRTSVHGQRNAKGDGEVAVCVDCHQVHGIRAISDPRSLVYPTNVAQTCAHCHNDTKKMDPYGVPTNQLAEYQTSIHFRAVHEQGDLSAPTCNDCHGSHGAAPPGVESVTSVCGTCHVREATLFRETEAKKQLDLDPCIRCMVCHSNHA
ncbi:MAG: NapC/NirT family cytochrome c, partial [Acidobacteria bacterium]|nr:NapC/NirT family cytochrome c [Acidobacteriota bacterium]